MEITVLRRPATLLLLCAALASCKDATGPGLLFPILPEDLMESFCNRGQRSPGQAISGSVSDTDCEAGDGSFFEVWRVRVPAAGTYQFTATSTFDNFLAVVRLDAYDDTSATTTDMGSDDDSGPGSNALLNVTLQPDVDYFLIVNGFSATDVGPYTATFTGP